jgi:hypothetical protein
MTSSATSWSSDDVTARVLLVFLVPLVFLGFAGGCSGQQSGGSPGSRARSASSIEEPAIEALRRGDFARAGRAADDALESRPDAARAAAVRAVSRYQAAGRELLARLEGMAERLGGGVSLTADLRKALLDTDRALAAVDADLAIAQADPGFALELCIACWSYDWDADRTVEEHEQRLLEIEYDVSGKPLPPGDARRRPTFRLDHGDILWARAMVAFQRAALHLGVAYDWTALATMLGDPPDKVVRIPLLDADSMARARQLALTALDFSDRCRAAFLAETDDDREWVPSPRQKSHPVPLEVDDRLYTLWADIVGDLRALLGSEAGISIGELFRLAPKATTPAQLGYLDLGRAFAEPRAITIDLRAADAISDFGPGVAPHVRDFFGYLWRDEMTRSPIIGRMRAARDSLLRGEPFEQKLRYILWFN